MFKVHEKICLLLIGATIFCFSVRAEIKGPGWYNETLMLPTGQVAAAQSTMTTLISTPISHQGQPDAITDEIRELARGLRYDPFAIYDYVHTKIDYVPYHGLLKGATLTLLDGCGNDFDQAALVFALLKESGYSPSYQFGRATIPISESGGNDLLHLFGVEDGMVPWVLGSCGFSNPEWTTDMFGHPAFTLDHIWIEVQINSILYRFDPSFKQYIKVDGINVASAMGYNRSSLLSAAGGVDDANYAQNINTNALYSHMITRNSQLLSTINQDHANADLLDVFGGYERQESVHSTSSSWLPYFVTVSNTWGWGGIPDDKTTKMRFQCNGIDITLSTAELHGRRLTFSFDASNRAQLRLDDTLLGTESSASGTTASLTLSIDHPYAALSGEHCDQTETKTYKRGGMYAIVYNFGGLSKAGHLKKRQQQLDVYREQGLAEDSLQVRSETLNILGLDWLKQTTLADTFILLPAQTLVVNHHRVGRSGQETSYYVDVGLDMATYLSRSDSVDDSDAAFRAAVLFHSAMEHSVLEQLQGADKPGVSTIRALELANRNGNRIYRLNSGNYSTAIRSELAATYPANMMTEFDGRIAVGEMLVLPSNGNLSLNSWNGFGYIAADADTMGMLISGGLSGGFGTVTGVVVSATVQNQYITACNYYYTEPASHTNPRSPEPVDLASGAYLYDAVDLGLGGAAPRGIAFKRSYNSHRNKADGVLGYGWQHNFESGISRRTSLEAAFGQTTPQAAATMMTAVYACFDLMKNPTRAKEWVTASLIACWATDQLLNNSASVQLGNKTYEFIEQPDGSFLAPAGITATLSRPGGNYTLQERHGNTFTFNANGKLASITDPDGNALSISYDGSNRPTTITDCTGRSIVLHYANGQLDYLTDSTGRTVDYSFNASGDLTGSTDPEGYTRSFIYDTNHRIIELRNPKNEIINQNVYDDFGNVAQQRAFGDTNRTWNYFYSGFETTEINPLGGQTKYYFDAKGRQTSVEDALSNKNSVVYDGQDHRIEITEPNGNQTRFLYDNHHNVVCITDAEGHITTNFYDSLHRLVKTIQPDCGITNRFVYDTEHHLIKTIDPKGYEVENTYYANGLLHTVTDQDDHTTTMTYDSYGQPDITTFPDSTTLNQDFSARGDLTRTADALGNETFYTYDKRRLPTSVTDELGHTVSNIYDAAGMLIQAIDARTNQTSFTYNAMEKPLTTTYVDGYTITNRYDLNDRLIAIADSVGLVSSNQLDPVGRVVQAFDALGRSVSNRYDNAGNLLQVVDPLQHSTAFTYDSLNRLVLTSNALHHTSLSQFDAAGRRTALETFGGSDLTFHYDLRGLQTNQLSHEGRTNRWVYNARGLLEQVVEPSGEKTVTTYNNRRRPTQIDFRNTAGTTVATQMLDYNANGSLTARTEGSRTVTYAYNALNQLTNYTDSATNRIGYAYNAGGLLSELTYPDGKVVHYRYDSRNRLTEVEDWAARITRYTYDLRGRLVGINHPNGTSRTNLYDTVNRLLQISDTDASGRMICQYDFTFDDADRITTELCRPVNWPYNPPDVDCTFDGDNRITSYNGQALSYDADGNLLQLPSNGVGTVTLTYDTRNRLQSVGGLSYVYDPSGHRIAVSNTAGATTFVINPNVALSQVLIRKKPDGTTTYYVYGLGLLYEETGTALRQYHSDLRGSTTVLTDGAGAVTDRFSYTPYGMMNARSGTTDTPFLYNGKYGVQTDANGLLHMRARYYCPTLRRFLQQDPIGLVGGVNLYLYGNANPLVYIDPLGLCAESGGSSFLPMGLSPAPSDLAISANRGNNSTMKYEAIQSLTLGANFSPASPIAEQFALDNAAAILSAPGGEIIGGAIGSRISRAVARAFGRTPNVANPVPGRLARVVPDTPITRASGTLGRPGASDVFVTAADDIAGMNAGQISQRLTIPQSPTGYRIMEFQTPPSGVASPILRTDPGFIGGGRTLGGAREFVIPNGAIPNGANTTVIRP